MKKAILVFSATLGLAGAAGAAEVVEDWLIAGGSGAASGNAWLDASHAGRGIDFISATAPQNTMSEAVVVVGAGVGATDNIQILAADDGQNLGSFAMTTTGDATLSHYRIATSEDGYIFVNGFGGTVQRYTTAGGAPVEVVADEIYATLTPALAGPSRALEVTGSVADGTCKIFVGKTLDIAVFGNSSAAPDTFTFLGSIATGLPANDVSAIGSHDGEVVYAANNQGVPVKKFTVSYTPSFSFTADGDVEGFNVFVKQGLALNADNSLVGLAESGGAEDGFAIAQVSVDGLTFTNIPPAAGLDDDGDAVYDAGTLELDSPTFIVDIAMDPATGEVYGYSPGNGATAPNGGVMNLRLDIPANVSDWAIY